MTPGAALFFCLASAAWTRTSARPQCPPLTSQFFFPSLQRITLRHFAASGWVKFLADGIVQRISTNTGPKPRSAAPHLIQLYCYHVAVLDVTFLSHFRVFRNLSILTIRSSCSYGTRCTFGLTDDDVGHLAMELPGLNELSLGTPCADNTCRTTVISLLALSTYCKGLRELCIHFNTRNLARDMRQSLHHHLRRNSHPPSRCPLAVLNVGSAPLAGEALGEEVFPTLAGLVDIFPKLQRIAYSPLRSSWSWRQLDTQIPIFQQMRRSLPAVFVQ